MSRRRALSLLESFNFAIEGIVHVLRTHRNMRLHFAAAIVILVAAVWVGVTRFELIALMLAIAFVLVAEMINSAVEQAIDVATTSFDPLAKLAKDIAAGAVLIAAVTAVAIGYLVFSRRLGEPATNAIDRLRNAPVTVTLAALALVTLIVIATKAWTGRGTPLRGGLPSGHAAIAFAGWMAVTYIVGAGRAPLHRLLDHVHHGRARGGDPGRGWLPLDARGRVRWVARRPRHSGRLPALLRLTDVNVTPADRELYEQAVAVSARAYAPYSRFLVGAAARTRDGRVFARRQRRERRVSARGVRGEVGADGGGDRPAAGRATWRPIAITASPCGGCRQWLVEMGIERVVYARAGGEVVVATPATSCRTRSSCDEAGTERHPWRVLPRPGTRLAPWDGEVGRSQRNA